MPRFHNRCSPLRHHLAAVFVGGLACFVLAPTSVVVAVDALTGSKTSKTVHCAARSDAAGLDEFFASDQAPLRADYQRTLALPDGRVLWTFQDAFLPTSNGGVTMVHSAGLVQNGNCFSQLRGGSSSSPSAWLLPERTTPYRHWFWPLGATIGSDGDVRVFVAEMRERGSHYLDKVEPVGTWVVRLRFNDLQVVGARPAADAGPSLYGWSVTSDANWTYLYGYCYRQFGWDRLPFGDPTRRAHDFDCSADVRVARVPLGHLDDPLRYWDGRTWGTDPSAAVAVMPTGGRPINPAQIRRIDGVFLAVTKQGDWFGDTITVDASPSAHGPWTPVTTVRAVPLCADCNTYFASFIAAPSRSGQIVVGLSNNTWSGELSTWYRPTILSVGLPSTTRRSPSTR